jgi:hypothetical protein
MDTQEMVTQTIKHLMLHCADTQETVGAALGVTYKAVSHRMTGKTAWTLKDLGSLARYWGLEPVDLLQGPTHAIGRLNERRGDPYRRVGA